ncbi:type II toxin-antitoxin system antitoxin SocA domain-containing protein [Arcobacter arenosus]|uniref:DUF4065 domain-containing protein n=1 Tax=Arcobacter arenosus TaxID=2576037 RepID=A0A5R8XY67_9BACT|nr:type II toxin-antitoxin system antitoxin SocA domain-containing protein [Arcobacter arenosus]TLP35562.1 DUF4065 domain-containing protein [Arcobacter arenosus]
MNIDITKVANVIIYMLDEDVKHLNDRKLIILLFLIDYNFYKTKGRKIFGDEYIKQKRNPEAVVLADIFDIIANGEDLEEDDERLYLITDMLDFIDIEILTKEKFIELNFLKMEEDFDSSMFDKEEMKCIKEIVEKYKDDTARKIANACFQIDDVRNKSLDEVII